MTPGLNVSTARMLQVGAPGASTLSCAIGAPNAETAVFNTLPTVSHMPQWSRGHAAAET